MWYLGGMRRFKVFSLLIIYEWILTITNEIVFKIHGICGKYDLYVEYEPGIRVPTL